MRAEKFAIFLLGVIVVHLSLLDALFTDELPNPFLFRLVSLVLAPHLTHQLIVLIQDEQVVLG